MKNLLDKPYKVIIYMSTLMLLSTTTLKGDYVLHKTVNVVASPPEIVAEVIEPSEKVDDEIIVAEVTEPIVVPEPQKKKQVIYSRGELPEKRLTEREIIDNYIREITARYNMEPELIMSMIISESDYNPRCTTGKCVGLMQVSTVWHQDRANKLGVTDFYDPYSNILLGVDYLSELVNQYHDIRLVLMLYNMNHQTAFNMYRNGQTSYYARTILSRAEQFKKGE